MPSQHPVSRREFGRRLALAAGACSLATTGRAAAAPVPDPPVRRGVWQTTHRPRALASPVQVPPGETWRYMLAYPFQVAPRLAALALNIKVTPGPGQDFPVGVDFLLFSTWEDIRAENALPFVRNTVEPNPNADGKSAIMAAYPPQVGFIPWGAKRADGSPHPHAGTGVAPFCRGARPLDDSEGVDNFPDRIGRGAFRGPRAYRVIESAQLRCDGRNLSWSTPRRWGDADLIGGYGVVNVGMSAGIPDGDDLLIPLVAGRPDRPKHSSGVSRWRRLDGDWRPVAYEPITPEDNSIEPSLVRDLDGSLLFMARGRRESGPPLRIWRQAKGRTDWQLIIHRTRLVNSTPVTLNTAVDGTPYMLTNLYQPEFRLPANVPADGGISRLEPKGSRGERSTVCLWALNDARDDFVTPLIVRDPLVDFGIPPGGTLWAADHPTGTVVQLGDGAWHDIFGYRVLEWLENTHQTPPSPQTGCYLDETISLGPPHPPWNF